MYIDIDGVHGILEEKRLENGVSRYSPTPPGLAGHHSG